MRNALYAPFRPELQHLEPFSVQDDDILQIYTKTSSNANEANLPPHGELKRPAISVGQRVIALRGKDILGKTSSFRTNSPLKIAGKLWSQEKLSQDKLSQDKLS